MVAEAPSPVFVLQDVMVGGVTGNDTSLNTGKGFLLLVPCLGRTMQRKVALGETFRAALR